MTSYAQLKGPGGLKLQEGGMTARAARRLQSRDVVLPYVLPGHMVPALPRTGSVPHEITDVCMSVKVTTHGIGQRQKLFKY